MNIKIKKYHHFTAKILNKHFPLEGAVYIITESVYQRKLIVFHTKRNSRNTGKCVIFLKHHYIFSQEMDFFIHKMKVYCL
ncbi:hypothetical protein C0J52_03072 [Blattella germanica]|nr:hypothetical protein C0J52_03072 [Blattella germanica]